MDAILVPVSHFTSESVPASKQFEAWRESHRLMFDVIPIGGREPGAFPASATTYQLGNVLFGRAAYAAKRFERDERRTAEGLDVVLVRLNLEGEHRGVADGAPIHARRDDIDVIDLMRPLAYESSGSSVLVLGIPGRILEAMVPNRAALHGFVTSSKSGMGAILGDYLRSLYARIGEISASEVAGVAAATITLTATCLRHLTGKPSLRALDGGGTLLAAIKEYIEAHLRSDDLSVETLCAKFSLSRAALYRLFSPLGGVARYVRDRRLVAAFVALADRNRSREPVSSIAFELKFASEAHFGRVFRAAFGCTPGQVRTLDLASASTEKQEIDATPALPTYMTWLERLARRDR